MKTAKKSTIKEYQEILKEIEDKKWKPIYALEGEEQYFIDEITHKVEQDVLDESVRDFSLFTYYGKDITHADLISACNQSSFLSPQTVVILKEGQDMKGMEKMENYFLKPNPNCLLIINYRNKTFNKNSKVYKALNKSGTVFSSKALYDNEVKSWIKSRVQELGLKIGAAETEILFAYLGNDLAKISMELDKVKLNLQEGEAITAEAIEEYIGISKDYNPYELTKALGEGNVDVLYPMLDHFESNPNAAPLMLVLGILSRYYLQLIQYHSVKSQDDYAIARTLKINPYFVHSYKTAAKRIDANKAKSSLLLIYDYNKKALGIGSNAKSEKLLTELVLRLFYA